MLDMSATVFAVTDYVTLGNVRVTAALSNTQYYE